MKSQEQSIHLALAAATRLSRALALLLLLTTRSAVSLEHTQPPDCPLECSFQVMIDNDDISAGADIFSSNRTNIVTLHLTESSADFLHSSERTGGGGGVVGFEGPQLESRLRLLPPCFYQGSVEGEDGLAVAKQRDGFISGHFHYAGRVFEIPEQLVLSGDDHLQSILLPPPAKKTTCGVSGSAIDTRVEAANGSSSIAGRNPRDRRGLLLDSHADIGGTGMKHIQLILIGDQYFYHNQSKDMVKAQDRLWEIGNYVNALYKQLGVSVVTVYTETWQRDPYVLFSSVAPGGANSAEMLDLFMIYRMQTLSTKPHSAAHLISGLKFAGTDVGLAPIGTLCSFEYGGGVNSDQDSSAYSVSVTVAHELGHNLGMEHDKDEGCACPDDQGCIMAAVGGDVNPMQFSSCSIATFKAFTVANGLGYCMSDPPADAAVVGVKLSCGNRIVETGEECDCGPAKWCKNRCCNPATCRFSAGAACATGECCDQATCQLKSQGTVCRAERDATCDLPEFCNGTSEWCPQLDDYKADGTECLAGKAYCYKGRCNDRDTRCAGLFQGDGVKSAPPEWSKATKAGSDSGYCNYTPTEVKPLTYTYTACTEANQRCGVLYCVGGHSSSKEPVPLWKGMPPGNIIDATIGEVAISAAFAQHNLNPSGYRDPGMVPNGAECGTEMMCVDSQCVSATASSVSCPSCNGNGFCARSGLCFCQAGFKPPDCLQAGNGGSVNNPMPGSAGAGGGSGSGGAASTAPTTTRNSAGPATAAAGATKMLIGLGLMMMMATRMLNFQ